MSSNTEFLGKSLSATAAEPGWADGRDAKRIAAGYSLNPPKPFLQLLTSRYLFSPPHGVSLMLSYLKANTLVRFSLSLSRTAVPRCTMVNGSQGTTITGHQFFSSSIL